MQQAQLARLLDAMGMRQRTGEGCDDSRREDGTDGVTVSRSFRGGQRLSSAGGERLRTDHVDGPRDDGAPRFIRECVSQVDTAFVCVVDQRVGDVGKGRLQ